MPGLKSVGFGGHHEVSPDQKVEQIRQQIGDDFTDKTMKDAHKRNEMGKNDFLKLMTTQLKYQDPISPLKNEEMAAQLAQFSALEQMTNVNQNLEKMQTNAKPQENMMAASLIGKRVVSDTSHFMYDKKDPATLKFELTGDIQSGHISVINEKGEVVRELLTGEMQKGEQHVKWDGKGDKGQEMAKGEYSFKISAKDRADKNVEVKTGAGGVVTGVVFESGRAVLMLGDQKVPFDMVGKIEDPVLASKESVKKSNAKPGISTASDDKTKNVDAKNLSTENPSAGENKTAQVMEDSADDYVPENLRNNLPNQKPREKIESSGVGGAKETQNVAAEDAFQNNKMGLWSPENL